MSKLKPKFNPTNRIVPIDYLKYLARLREYYADQNITQDINIIRLTRKEFGFGPSLANRNVVRQACQILDNVKHISGLKQKGKARTKRQNDLFFASDEWKQLRYIALKKAKGCCQCCGTKASMTVNLHVDHIKPRSKFPELELDISNLQVLCPDCNQGKAAWDDTDWRQPA